MTTWRYPPEFIETLAGHGLAPTATTPPTLLREAVNDLYRIELRAARDRLLANRIAKADYLSVVVSLRKKYWLLTLPLSAWERICAA